MRKLFTIDDLMVAFVSALGYGFGDSISRLLGWPKLVCAGVSLVLGVLLEQIISRIAFSKAVQKKPINRVLVYVAFLLIFLIAHNASVKWMGVSMLDYLRDQFVSVIGFPILGFGLNLLIRAHRIKKIRRLYGNGSEGYVFDVKKEDIEAVNQQNQSVPGKYDADCAVRTRTGIYVGEKHGKTISYLGIPYAKPPVGALRWKAPEPLPASEAVFEAKNFGASAIQVDHKGSIVKHHRQSEDCLTLNISVGKHNTETGKPVLVFFHHGDFTYGGSVDPLFYGDSLVAAHPEVLFVSFNYRLGIFGFIDFSEIPGGEACPDAPNLGLLDQVAALKWIRENIAAFGGDPDRITVIGFESGATSICLLSVSEQAKGLFRKAFVFNGSPELAYNTPEASRALARKLAEETQAGTMEALLQLKTESLKDAAQRLWENMCAPTCDGARIPVDVYRAWRDGAASGVDFIIGIPSDEMRVLRSFIGSQNYETLVNTGMADLKAALAGATQAQVGTQTAATGLEAKSKRVELWNAFCIYRSAAKLSQGGNTVHLLYWDEKPLIENLGSGSVNAEATLLGNSDASQMYGSVMNADLSEILQRLLLKFVNGEALQLYPNEIKGVDALDWKAFPRALIVSDEKLVCERIP